MYGLVKDTMSNAIPRAQVAIVQTGRTTVVDSAGQFKIGEERPAGSAQVTFTVIASAAGFLPESTNVSFSTRDSAFVNFILRPIATTVTDTKQGPLSFTLHQNSPNPFNPTTTITFSLPAPNRRETLVTLKVFDMLGREIATLANEEMGPGTHQVQFNASGLASGVYVYRLQSGTLSATRTMVILR